MFVSELQNDNSLNDLSYFCDKAGEVLGLVLLSIFFSIITFGITYPLVFCNIIEYKTNKSLIQKLFIIS